MKLYLLYEDAKERIKERQRWCQGVSAKTAEGRPCEPGQGRAYSWCLEGSLYESGYKLLGKGWTQYYKVAEHLQKFIQQPMLYPFKFNDRAFHHEVLELLDKAIANAKEHDLEINAEED